ncbi:Ref family protein [Luteimonas sp. XNQY3]|nr:Ref family recombination enhancement nuclease [Luteimonas sp. XNQY3]MCD9005199.1 Ref family protein [Luteimonas sp. XNQY3]
MRRGRSTSKPTREESAWIDTVKRLGCLCCRARGYPHDPDGPVVEAHHLLYGGIRRGHLHTVGLCAWHHRGRLIVYGWSHAQHRQFLGPSLAEGSGPFRVEFGDDESLMAAQHRLIEKSSRKAV